MCEYERVWSCLAMETSYKLLVCLNISVPLVFGPQLGTGQIGIGRLNPWQSCSPLGRRFILLISVMYSSEVCAVIQFEVIVAGIHN